MYPDIMTTLPELNDKKKHCVYIIAMGDVLVAATSKADLDKYLNSDESLLSPQMDIDEVFLIYGFVMDIEELPFEISAKMLKDRSLWLFRLDDLNIIGEPYESIAEIASTIENTLAEDGSLELEDFVVVLGEELEMALSVSNSGQYMNTKDVYD